MASESAAKRAKQELLFKDQIAIVTGGADGIGRSIVRMLVENGANVVIFDVNEEKMKDVAKTLMDEGYTVTTVGVDVSDDDSVRKAFEKFNAKFDSLDIMINCAGIVGPNGMKVEDVSVEDFDRVYGGEYTESVPCLVTKDTVDY